MEFKKILLLGMFLFGGGGTLFSAEASEVGPVRAEKMVKIQTSDHTENEPKQFEMPMHQAKKIGLVANLLEDLGEEECVYRYGESNHGKQSIPLLNIDSERFKIIKQWIEADEDALSYNEETKIIERIKRRSYNRHRKDKEKSSLQRFIGELEGQALFDTLLNIGQAIDFLDLHIFDGEATEKHEWTSEVVADLLVEFLKENKDAFLNGELQFPQETQDAGGFLGKLVKDRLINNIINGQVILSGNEESFSDFALGADETLYLASFDGIIRVWQRGVYGQYGVSQVLEGHTDKVKNLVVGADGTLYSGSDDKTIRVWQRGVDGQYRVSQVLRGHRWYNFPLVVGADGTLYSELSDRTIRVWQRGEDGQYGEVQVLQGHTYRVTALVVGAGGTLCSGSDDKTIRVWQRDANGHYRESQVFQGDTQSVTALVLGADGTLYSGSNNGTIKVWQRGRDGQYREAQVLEGHTKIVFDLALGADGTLYSGSFDGTIRVWQRGADDQYRERERLGNDGASYFDLALGEEGVLYSLKNHHEIRIWNLWIENYKDILDWKQAAVLMFVDKAQRLPREGSDAYRIYQTIDKAIRKKEMDANIGLRRSRHRLRLNE